ncbi:MAG: serine hydrolase domain-containing protein [Mycobacteriales bacterium]
MTTSHALSTAAPDTFPDNQAQAGCLALCRELVSTGAELGLQVAAYLDGRLVVDVVAGVADPATGAPMAWDTLVPAWSTGKGVTATAVHVLVDRGLLDYDTPIAAYWPEFGAHGKERATLRHALTHAAGIPSFPPGVTHVAQLADWDRMCAAVAGMAAEWEPGSATGYHGWTYGWIVGEAVRRATGRRIEEVVSTEVAAPLGVDDLLYCGVPAAEVGRVAAVVDGGWAGFLDRMPPAFRRVAPAPFQPVAALAQHREVTRAVLPANGTMTAFAAARMYAALLGPVDGVRLISAGTLAAASAPASFAEPVDRVFGFPVVKALGYFTGLPFVGGRPTSFGMNGSGGGTAFADPEQGFAFALTKNRMTGGEQDTAERLVGVIRAALDLPA